MKKCFKCGKRKPLLDFYRHKMMSDGHVNKCKECNKKDVISNRKSKIEYYREYDRTRGNRHKVGYMDEYKKRYKNKSNAVIMVNNAIRDKRLFKEPCEVCGTKKYVHAHHDDYKRPLNVRWLCAAHHRQWHIKNGEGKNG